MEITTISYAAADTVQFFDASCFPQDTGVFIQLFTNQFGCDSLVVETIALNPSDTTYLFATSCNPQ
ncbi:hypothetical protein RZS08_56850, partial [Arthrospira platensis SPKY1]|nr:hypothetical protein [Arthrospira platensis SPKY1]